METVQKAKRLGFAALAILISAHRHADLRAQEIPHNTCRRLSEGSTVPEPEDLRSRNGELTVDLRIHNYIDEDGSVRYCYTTPDGKESPNLRLNPGDLLTLNLKNDLTDVGPVPEHHHHPHVETKNKRDACISGVMKATSTN